MRKSEQWKQLRFVNRFVKALPADPVVEVYPRQVENACYSRVEPTCVSGPQLVAYSKEVAALLEIEVSSCDSQEFAEVFSGNLLIEGMDPYAACYGGHQFGNWAGQLGDGRAINLGELKTSQETFYTLQLKGAGLTPYSRTADGLAVLRSSVREFLCSEAMYHLGVPTTRALSLCLTGEHVVRDMFYDGNPKPELGAVVCRVAPSFTRFGNFEILSARGDYQLLQQLVDYTIKADFPELGAPSSETYLQWFREVCQRTARMIVEWMRVGFVHGVMNTDNMSILGQTIDYGPYGWVDDYDPDWTPNTTDASNRRYRFGQQAEVAHWNLFQLARVLAPLFDQVEPLQSCLNEFPSYYKEQWRLMKAKKLGFQMYLEGDDSLFDSLDGVLRLVETDMTLFYRCLAEIEVGEQASQNDDTMLATLAEAYYDFASLTEEERQKITEWLRLYIERCRKNEASFDRRSLMNSVNPLYVLRNYTAQVAIDEADKGNFSAIQDLLDLLRNPYEKQKGKESFAAKRPEWARHRAGCSMLSCSS